MIGEHPDTTIGHLLREGSRQLAELGSARLDTELLLASTCRIDRVALYRDHDAPITPAAATKFRRLIRARRHGVPIAYLTGHKEFWSFDLHVSAAVLVPRPDTELLVRMALDRLPADRDARILDLGTGSGAVAIALAIERPRTRIDAVDRSASALRIAEKNLERLAIDRVRLYRSDWFNGVPAISYDLIVSNPPYVETSDPALRDGPTGFEPRIALDGGADGLDSIRRIVEQAPKHLVTGGWLLLEHGASQASRVRDCVARHGFRHPVTESDLQGLERVTAAKS